MILAIESSCDETACAVVRRTDKNRFEVLSNVILSQIEIHKQYGGVVPEVASRQHVENIDLVVSEAIKGIDISEIEAVAATFAPGLIGALLVGFNFAKAFAYARNLPFIPVHHIEGHICANYIENDMPKLINNKVAGLPRGVAPRNDEVDDFLCLVVSGGHSHIVRVRDYAHFEVLARTRDDAVGEAFDKISRCLGLGYPGGPAIEKAARDGDENAFVFPKVRFARTTPSGYACHPSERGEYDFSFSGVKTAVISLVRSEELEVRSEDIAASFQKTVCETLTERLMEIAEREGIKTVAISGGVACNGYLREMIKKQCEERNLNFAYPSPIFCTDNAAMIGVRAFYHLDKKEFGGLDSNARATFIVGDRFVVPEHY